MRIIFWSSLFKNTFLLVFLMIAHSASSQTLGEYLDWVKNDNMLLQLDKNQIQTSQQEVLLTKAALRPSIGMEVNYQRDFTKSFLFINDEETAALFGDRFRTNFNNNLTLDLIASHSLYDPTAKATHQLAQLAEELSKRSHKELSNTLVHQASQLFWQAIFSRESLKVLDANQQLAKDQWQQMRDLFDEGYASELQVRQSESFYKRTISQVESARNSHQILLNELKTLASLPLDYPLDLKGAITIADSTLTRYFITDTNLTNNPQLKVLHQQLAIAEQQIKVAKAARRPIIKARLGYNLNAQDDGFSFANNIHLLYGQIGIQIPIYTGGATKAMIQKNSINKTFVKIQIEQQRLNLKKELSNATFNFQNALHKIKAEKEGIQLSKREWDIAKEGIKQGLVTPLELKEIRLEWTAGQLRLLNAYLDLRIARLQMESLLGTQ
ncbi:MAG: TolC family protein [Bacteroidota bacterium]